MSTVEIEAVKRKIIDVKKSDVKKKIKELVKDGYRIEAVGDKEIRGICEGCSGPVFDDIEQPYIDVDICADCQMKGEK